MHKINLFPLFGFYLYVFSTSKKRELAWQQLWICSITINWIMELEESVDFHCIPVKEKNGDKCLIFMQRNVQRNVGTVVCHKLCHP